MSQSLKWLCAAAFVLVPEVAFAQKKNPSPPAAAQPAPASADTPPAASPAPASADPEPTPSATPSAATPGDSDICAIAPDAPECKQGSKPLDLQKPSEGRAQADIWAVTQIYALKYHRFEVNPYWAVTLNDQFVSHPGPGLAVNYYLTNVLAVGVNGTWYGGLNSEPEFNFQNRRASRIAVPLNEYQWGANLNFTYVPVYGKFAGFGDFIFNYDIYAVAGVGAISTRPISVIDPDNRTFKFEPRLVLPNVGLGLRIFINRWFAANLELRDYIYVDKLENLQIAPGQQAQKPETWEGETKLTNNVQAQLGISIFFPFSFEYRLVK